jgi:hypothetical protein
MSKIVSTASVCDGAQPASSVIERADGTFEAIDASDRSLGRFKGQVAASRAIPAPSPPMAPKRPSMSSARGRHR